MDLILVSGRPSSPEDPAGRQRIAPLAEGLVALGHRVRWIRPLRSGEGESEPIDGVQILGVESPVPDFAAISSRLYDVPNERLLVRELREDPPDLVHVDGYGGTSAYLTTWLSERMGIPVTVLADPLAPILCHRGTFLDETGDDCDRFDEPTRCLECCTTPFEGGLTEGESWRARHLAWLGPLAPSPVLANFENRLDMMIHGLDSADRVYVYDDEQAEKLKRCGLPRKVVVGYPTAHQASAWLKQFEELVATHTPS